MCWQLKCNCLFWYITPWKPLWSVQYPDITDAAKKGFSSTHTSLTPPVIFCCALQVNQITAFIDGSNVYGSDVSTARRLRLGRRGRLRVTRLESEDLLPLAPEECADHSKRQYCFAAGNKEPLSCPDKLFSIQSSDLTRCLFRSKAFTWSESWKRPNCEKRSHIVEKLPKMSHLDFEFWHFPPILSPIKLILSGNTVWG